MSLKPCECAEWQSAYSKLSPSVLKWQKFCPFCGKKREEVLMSLPFEICMRLKAAGVSQDTVLSYIDEATIYDRIEQRIIKCDLYFTSHTNPKYILCARPDFDELWRELQGMHRRRFIAQFVDFTGDASDIKNRDDMTKSLAEFVLKLRENK